MNSVKIIFFDIDGTLVDPATGQISEKTREALDRLRKKGILLCVATGRPPASLPDLEGLHFDVFCTSNGALCYTDKEILFHCPLPAETVTKVMENAARLGRPVSLALRDRLVANGFEKDLADYYALAGLELTVAEDFDSASQEDVYQIMLGCREEDHEAILRGTTGVKLAISWDRAVDVIPVSGGKGASIAKILDHFGLDASQAMAFGDSYNDLDMLEAVGAGIAMGNAAAPLKAIADEVCGHISENGIYCYCIEKGLI